MAKRLLIIDSHIDAPYRLMSSWDEHQHPTEDLSKATGKGDFDYPRAVAGGLNVPFMSIFVPSRYQKTGGAKARADTLIDMVEGMVKKSPGSFAIPHTVAEVHANFSKGLMSLPLGIENGAAIESKLENLTHFARRGVRYITLTHGHDNAICDSSYDDKRTWKGMSPFGKEVIAEMNRLGIMIDVSHVSDQAFEQVMAITKTPVIATHSSCRHFTPDFERNMSDTLIKRLAGGGGVIAINFGSEFLDGSIQKAGDIRREAIKAYTTKQGLNAEDPSHREHPDVEAFTAEYDRKKPRMRATVATVADHIEHVIKLVGIDHVGIGSDFEGVGATLPEGLKDASEYPNLIEELLARGHDEASIAKIFAGNTLRVWKAVEDYARTYAAK